MSETKMIETPASNVDEELQISNFSTYEANKMLIAQNGKPISKLKLNTIIGDMAVRFRKWVWDNKYKYFMLLCKDRSDYTLFNMVDSNFDIQELKEALKDCFTNRGDVYDIHYEKNTDAYEIWLKIEDEFYAYYLFPYDIGVIEIGAVNG
jgi:hypothetical protein